MTFSSVMSRWSQSMMTVGDDLLRHLRMTFLPVFCDRDIAVSRQKKTDRKHNKNIKFYIQSVSKRMFKVQFSPSRFWPKSTKVQNYFLGGKLKNLNFFHIVKIGRWHFCFKGMHWLDFGFKVGLNEEKKICKLKVT